MSERRKRRKRRKGMANERLLREAAAEARNWQRELKRERIVTAALAELKRNPKQSRTP